MCQQRQHHRSLQTSNWVIHLSAKVILTMHCHNGNLSSKIGMRYLKGARAKGNGKMVSRRNLTAQFVMRKGYRSVQNPQPYIEKLVIYASKSFILHPINVGLICSAGWTNYPSNEASYNFEYVLGVLHGPFGTSRLPYLTDTNHGCWGVYSHSAAQNTLGRFQRAYGKLREISILNPCYLVPNKF